MKKKRSFTEKIFRSLVKHFLLTLLRLQKPFLLKNRKIKDTKINTILILAYMGIGDMIMFIPALKQLRKKYPHAKITVQTGLKNSCEQVIKNSDLVDEFLDVYLDTNFFKFIKRGRRCRNRFDLLLSEFHNPYYQLAFQILYMQIPIRITHATSSGYQNPFDFLFNHRIPMREDEHTIERELDLLRPLGIDSDLDQEKNNTRIYLSDEDLNYAAAFWHAQKLADKIVIGIQAGTAPLGRWKQWPVRKFRELIHNLTARNYKILLFGAPSEREMIEDIAREISPPPVILAGKVSFLQSCAIMGKCDYMITNDSGLMHVANALEVPLIAIYGPTDYRRTAPLGKNSQIVRKGLDCSPCFKLAGDEMAANCPFQYRCMHEITVEEVLYLLRFGL